MDQGQDDTKRGCGCNYGCNCGCCGAPERAGTWQSLRKTWGLLKPRWMLVDRRREVMRAEATAVESSALPAAEPWAVHPPGAAHWNNRRMDPVVEPEGCSELAADPELP